MGLFCTISSLLQASFAKETYKYITYIPSFCWPRQPIIWEILSLEPLDLQNIVSFTGLFCKRDLQIYHIYTEFLLAETANHLGDIIVRALGFAKRHDEHFVVVMQRVLGRCRHFVTHSVELLP